MRRAIVVTLALVLTVGPAWAGTPPGEGEWTLERGIQQINEGNFQAALVTLDVLARSLAVDPGTSARALSQAYLYRGVAFVGLAQEADAKGSFAAALQYDRTLRIGDDRFPPRVVRVFEAARLGKTKSVLLPPSGKARKAGIGALGIAGIVGGVLAAGAGAAVATGGSRHTNGPPKVGGITASPEGQAITGVTVVTFRASATDPEGDPLTFAWDLGHGTTASGESVNHVYPTEGSFTVRLTVNDPNGGSAASSATVTARSLTGTWIGPPRDIEDAWNVTQHGGNVTGIFVLQGAFRYNIRGTVAHPREVRWTRDTFPAVLTGTVDAALTTINGQLCNGSSCSSYPLRRQ